MKAEIVKLNRNNLLNNKIKEAGDLIKAGKLVAFPTETVYGLGGDALNKEAANKIYSAKGRPSDNPLIVHIAEIDKLNEITKNIPQKAKQLINKLWPGPLTIILEKTDIVPYETTGGLDTVAVRFPSDSIAIEFIKAAGGFVAAPSANTSGRPSPTKADHVVEDLGNKIPMVLDGGQVDIGLESTIVDFTDEIPTILRPGFYSLEYISSIIGSCKMDKGLKDPKVHPKAPGMKYRHYAPSCPLTIVDGNRIDVVEKINELVNNKVENKKIGIICTDDTKKLYNDKGIIKTIGSREDPNTIAHNLYKVLREMDEENIEEIYSEAFFIGEIGSAIMNRLLKAAGQNIIYAGKEEL